MSGKEYKITNEKKCKILLLGTGQSGKSTIRKQMHCIYGEGYNEGAKRSIASYIFSNLVSGARYILNRIEEKDDLDKLIDPQSIIAANIIKETGWNINKIDQDIAESLNVLWNDDRFRKEYFDRAKYQLDNCWIMFMDKLKDYPKWGGPDWIPSLDDYIRVRIRTSGIIEESFQWNNTNYKCFDVGGARGERRKWIHLFDGSPAIVYVADLSCYDERLYEDRSKNSLVESLELFDEIANSKWFVDSKFYLIVSYVMMLFYYYVTIQCNHYIDY